MEYRHELKFLVSEKQLELLRFKLNLIMKQDIHQQGDAYKIRSLYFDDFYDTCLRENESGVDRRKKYRIRIYNGSTDVIKLEKKIKFRGMTKKYSSIIKPDNCFNWIKSSDLSCMQCDSDLEKELYFMYKAKGMRPVTIVEYERTAFVEKRGNVRITFDRNISCSTALKQFAEKTIPLIPLLPVGQHILEVKYDEYLPDYIKETMEIGTLQRSTFSKYVYARNYKNNLR